MEVDNYLRFVLALVFVLGLIGVLAMIVRRYGPGSVTAGRRTANRRLWISEVLPLDGRRRLILVRRDNVEHLLLLSHGSDVVVESGIAAEPNGPDDDVPAGRPRGPLQSFKAAIRSVGEKR